MEKKTNLTSVRRVFFPLLIFILITLIGTGVLFNQIASGNQRLRTWTDISIILISLILFIPGLTFLFMLIWVIHFVTRANRQLPVWFERIQIKVTNTSSFFISFARALPKPFILFESIIKGFPSLINKK